MSELIQFIENTAPSTISDNVVKIDPCRALARQ